MKEYDFIVIGTGSCMNFLDVLIQRNPKVKIAVIDKDEPGGICLTRGCIPTKILVYPADVVREIENAEKFGIDVEFKGVNFEKVMKRMRLLISNDINMIREGLSHSSNVDYYPTVGKFIAPYTLKVNDDVITSKVIFLCTGSRPMVPQIKGLEELGYYDSDSVLKIDHLPEKLAIIGGGYIAAEYGHFFSAMGSDVTIIGRNPQFLPKEEEEVSDLAKQELGRNLKIITNHEVRRVEKENKGKKKIVAINRSNEKEIEVIVDSILVATGRISNTDILDPKKGGIEIDNKGWIIVNEYLETSQPNVWALGDANGKYQFKHVANYESLIVYYNAILKRKKKVNYHAIPHAVFSHPEVAGVGLKEYDAIQKYGNDRVLIGFQRYQDTAKGEAMDVKDFFVKVIVEKDSMKILGAHIIGPYASILVQEIINLMYTQNQDAYPIINGMHIHPALSEVVERAFRSLMTPEEYHHRLNHQHKKTK